MRRLLRVWTELATDILKKDTACNKLTSAVCPDPTTKRTLVQSFNNHIAIGIVVDDFLTIYEEVILGNVFSRSHCCSAIVSKVENSGFDA
jgi:hypothetical protein